MFVRSRPSLFRATDALLDRFSLRNYITPNDPYDIKYDTLRIETKKKYTASRISAGGGTKMRWYPETVIYVDLSEANTWMPEATKGFLKESYPYFYMKATNEFRVRTLKGETFAHSTEHAMDNLIHILHHAHKVTVRDGSKFVFDQRFFDYSIPFLFRHTEQKWLDYKRRQNQYPKMCAFMDTFGEGRSFKTTGRHLKQEGVMGKGYSHAAVLSQYEYDPNVSFRMDPFFKDQGKSEERLGGGCAWV